MALLRGGIFLGGIGVDAAQAAVRRSQLPHRLVDAGRQYLYHRQTLYHRVPRRLRLCIGLVSLLRLVASLACLHLHKPHVVFDLVAQVVHLVLGPL